MEKPLFIPLKRKFYIAFADGIKDTEYRRYGARWNERTCRVGRAVTISLGYGKAHRLSGVVVGFRRDSEIAGTPDFIECYGHTAGSAACIQIKLTCTGASCPRCGAPALGGSLQPCGACLAEEFATKK
jgi:hypothetical protein